MYGKELMDMENQLKDTVELPQGQVRKIEQIMGDAVDKLSNGVDNQYTDPGAAKVMADACEKLDEMVGDKDPRTSFVAFSSGLMEAQVNGITARISNTESALCGDVRDASIPSMSSMFQQTASAPAKHSHYHKDVSKLQFIDTYRVCALFEVRSQPVGHAIKKLLMAGRRGAKDYKQDLLEAIDSVNRELEMLEEDSAS